LAYRAFPQEGNQPGTKSWSLLLDLRLYILLVAMWLTVYDGMLVVSAGSQVWKYYGRGYPHGAADWGTWFSVTNCIFSIGLSALLDFLLNKLKSTRPRLYSIFTVVIGLIPAAVAIIFRKTDIEPLFGVMMSAMGIAFGFGLTQIPALVSDVFGNDKYGFAFGIVQIGAIVASASTMPIVESLRQTGIMVCFIVAAVGHLVVAGAVFAVLAKSRKPNQSSVAEILLGAD
jgi:hypothetical protein